MSKTTAGPPGCAGPPSSARHLQLILSAAGLVPGTKDEPNGVVPTSGEENPPNWGEGRLFEGETMDGAWEPTLQRE